MTAVSLCSDVDALHGRGPDQRREETRRGPLEAHAAGPHLQRPHGGHAERPLEDPEEGHGGLNPPPPSAIYIQTLFFHTKKRSKKVRIRYVFINTQGNCFLCSQCFAQFSFYFLFYVHLSSSCGRPAGR